LGDIGTLSLGSTGHKLSDEQDKIVTDFLKDDTKRWLTFNVKLDNFNNLTVTIDKMQRCVSDGVDFDFLNYYIYPGEFRLLNFISYLSADTYSSSIFVYKIPLEIL
jgi:hypothetical protein